MNKAFATSFGRYILDSHKPPATGHSGPDRALGHHGPDRASMVRGPEQPSQSSSAAAAVLKPRSIPHQPHERRDPHIRRQRHRRVARHLFWRRYRWLVVVGAGLAGVLAFVGGLWLTALLLAGGGHSDRIAAAEDFSPAVMQTCQESMQRVSCGCFWDRSQSVYTAENISGILQALVEREQWGPAITRARLVRAAGEDGARVIGRALYDCVQM